MLIDIVLKSMLFYFLFFRSDLAPVILQLKSLGIGNVLRFTFLSVSIQKIVVKDFKCHHLRSV